MLNVLENCYNDLHENQNNSELRISLTQKKGHPVKNAASSLYALVSIITYKYP